MNSQTQCNNKKCNKKSEKRCGDCKCVAYCSRECQKADWKSSHRYECKKMSLQHNNNNNRDLLQNVESEIDDNSVVFSQQQHSAYSMCPKGSKQEKKQYNLDENCGKIVEDRPYSFSKLYRHQNKKKINNDNAKIGVIFKDTTTTTTQEETKDEIKSVEERINTLEELLRDSRARAAEKQKELNPVQLVIFVNDQIELVYNTAADSVSISSSEDEALPNINTYQGIATAWNNQGSISLLELLKNILNPEYVEEIEQSRLELEQQYSVSLAIPVQMLFADSALESMIDNDVPEYAKYVIGLWKYASQPQRNAMKLIVQEKVNPILTIIPDQLIWIARKYDNSDYIDLIVDLYGENNLPRALLEGRLHPNNGRISNDITYPKVLQKILDLGWQSKSDVLNWRNYEHIRLLWNAQVKFNNDPVELLDVPGILQDAELLSEFIEEAKGRMKQSSDDNNQMQVDDDDDDNSGAQVVSQPIDLTQYPNSQALRVAAENFFADSIPVLIRAGADVNRQFGDKNRTALHIVASYNMAEFGVEGETEGPYERSAKTAQKLVNVKETNLLAKDSDGNTPLHLVENPNIARVLLERIEKKKEESVKKQYYENRNNAQQRPFDIIKDKVDTLARLKTKTLTKQSKLDRLIETLELLARRQGIKVQVKRKRTGDDNNNDSDEDVEDKVATGGDTKRTRSIQVKLEEIADEQGKIQKDIERWEKELKELKKRLTVLKKESDDDNNNLQENLIWLQLLKSNLFAGNIVPLTDYERVLEKLRQEDSQSVSENKYPIALDLIKFLPGGPFSNTEKFENGTIPPPEFIPVKPNFRLPAEAIIEPKLAYRLLQVSLNDDFKKLNLQGSELQKFNNLLEEPIVYERIIETAIRFNAQFTRMLIEQARKHYDSTMSADNDDDNDNTKSFQESVGASSHFVKGNFNTFRSIVGTDLISQSYAPVLREDVNTLLSSLTESQKKQRLRVLGNELYVKEDINTINFLTTDQPAFGESELSTSTTSTNRDNNATLKRRRSLLHLFFGEIGDALSADRLIVEPLSLISPKKQIDNKVFVTLARNIDVDWRALLFPLGRVYKDHNLALFEIVAVTSGGPVDAIRLNDFKHSVDFSPEQRDQTALQVWAQSPNVTKQIFDKLLQLTVPEESEAASAFRPFDTRVLTQDTQRNLIHLAANNPSSGHLVLRAIVDNFQSKFSRSMANARDSTGKTPLHLAVSSVTNADKRAKILIDDLGADINLKDAQGNTPLHIAAQNSLPATRLLLSFDNIDKDGRNGAGQTARDLAKNKPIRDLFDLPIEEIRKKVAAPKKRGAREVEQGEDDEDDNSEEQKRRRTVEQELQMIMSKLNVVQL